MLLGRRSGMASQLSPWCSNARTVRTIFAAVVIWRGAIRAGALTTPISGIFVKHRGDQHEPRVGRRDQLAVTPGGPVQSASAASISIGPPAL